MRKLRIEDTIKFFTVFLSPATFCVIDFKQEEARKTRLCKPKKLICLLKTGTNNTGRIQWLFFPSPRLPGKKRPKANLSATAPKKFHPPA
jgi:hypothetical protein